MAFADTIRAVIKKQEDGIYTVRELFPLLVKRTLPGDALDLLLLLPPEIRSAFESWVRQYPLEGGMQIRDSEEKLSLKTIMSLKDAVAQYGGSDDEVQVKSSPRTAS
jgi:hypothetical protein